MEDPRESQELPRPQQEFFEKTTDETRLKTMKEIEKEDEEEERHIKKPRQTLTKGEKVNPISILTSSDMNIISKLSPADMNLIYKLSPAVIEKNENKIFDKYDMFIFDIEGVISPGSPFKFISQKHDMFEKLDDIKPPSDLTFFRNFLNMINKHGKRFAIIS